MDPRAWFTDLTAYFVYVLFVATLGPLLFGFHLVPTSSVPSTALAMLTSACSLSSTRPKMSFAARRTPSLRPPPASRNVSR